MIDKTQHTIDKIENTVNSVCLIILEFEYLTKYNLITNPAKNKRIANIIKYTNLNQILQMLIIAADIIDLLYVEIKGLFIELIFLICSS